jgi:hypothetical protein
MMQKREEDKAYVDGQVARLLFMSCVHVSIISERITLRTVTVATGRKPLWSRVTGPSLLPCHYSGGIAAMDRRHMHLLWFLVVMGVLMSSARRY